MSTNKNIDRILLIAALAAVVLTILFMCGRSLGIQVIVDEDSDSHKGNQYFTGNDLNGDPDTSAAVRIEMNGNNGTVFGGGAFFENGDLIIDSAGSFLLTGSLQNGSIIVEAAQNAKVRVILDGVSVYSEDDAAFRVNKSDKVFLTLAQGSDNRLESGKELSESALSDKTDGVIFSHEDLTINGSGSLSVSGGSRFGIVSNDDLVITGGKISVSSVSDALRSNDSLRITDADIILESGKDGIHSGKDLLIAGGKLEITAGDDGIHSDSSVSLIGGTVDILNCYEGIEAASIVVDDGQYTICPVDDGINASGLTAGSSSFTLNGGNIYILNTLGQDADGIDSNGDITINGGALHISLNGSGNNSALDFGSESGGKLRINGGTVTAAGGSAMFKQADTASLQPVIQYFTESTSSDCPVSLLDDTGSELISDTLENGCTALILSCPELELNRTYTLNLADNSDILEINESADIYGKTTFGSLMNSKGSGLPESAGPGQPDLHNNVFDSDRITSEDDQVCFYPVTGEQLTMIGICAVILLLAVIIVFFCKNHN